MIIGIIGAGAAGMAAALAASENPKARIILMERQAKVGRKLAATGNGRCNLTNIYSTAANFHGDSCAFANYAMELFPPQENLAWFARMGLLTVTEESGRVYPYSDQAASVVEVLSLALSKPNIQLKTGFEVTKVEKKDDKFLVTGAEGTITCDKLIIACGGLAGTKLGGSMFGYRLLARFGHRYGKLRPALVQLKSDWRVCSTLKGVRANCKAEILRDGKPYSASTGELQFTEYGLSGPVIFEISRDACQGEGEWVCKLDFLPQIEQDQLLTMLVQRKHLPAQELLTGILHSRLGRVLVKEAGIEENTSYSTLSNRELEAICSVVKDLQISLTEPLGMDAAQVTAGGVFTAEFEEKTMESRLVPGLYACGEVLDIDGDCGGHNLQWAWSSGRLAGASAGKE